jgi:uncharacterized protein
VNYFYCDASAVIKRYLIEIGSPLINHLFDTVPRDRLVMLTPGVGETLSALVRRRNSGALSLPAYQQASQALRSELILAGTVQLKPAEDTLVFASLPLIEKHSINSTDALVLRSALDTASTLWALGQDLVLVASDTRLLVAALAEGLNTWNPETDTQAQLDTLTASP